MTVKDAFNKFIDIVQGNYVFKRVNRRSQSKVNWKHGLRYINQTKSYGFHMKKQGYIMAFWRKLFGKSSNESEEIKKIEKIVAGVVDAMQQDKWQPHAVAAGKNLYKLGGRNYMMIAYAMIESHSGDDIAKALSLCWDAIGGWNGATGSIQIQNKGDSLSSLSKVFRDRVEQIDRNSRSKKAKE